MSTPTNRRPRRNRIAAGALGVIVVIALAGVAAGALPGQPDHQTDTTDTTTSGDSTSGDRPTGVYQLTDADIEALRTATAPFVDSEAAVAAGRLDLELCFDMMGDHFADPATFGDGILNPVDPEALVYAEVDGARQMVAVEWVSTTPGEVLGIPLHLNHDLDVWVLHAWIGLDNPSGMLPTTTPTSATARPDRWGPRAMTKTMRAISYGADLPVSPDQGSRSSRTERCGHASSRASRWRWPSDGVTWAAAAVW